MSKFPTNPELRAALVEHRTNQNYTNTQLGKALNQSPTFISKYINDKLDHNPRDFENKAFDMLKALKERVAMTAEIFECGFSKAIEGRINKVRKMGDTGCISSPSGFGKTEGGKLYKMKHPSTIICTARAGAGDAKGAERLLFASCENREWRGNGSRWDYLVDRFQGSSRVIINDNAQRFDLNGIRWWCDFNDITGCPVIHLVQDGFLDRLKRDPAWTGHPSSGWRSRYFRGSR